MSLWNLCLFPMICQYNMDKWQLQHILKAFSVGIDSWSDGPIDYSFTAFSSCWNNESFTMDICVILISSAKLMILLIENCLIINFVKCEDKLGITVVILYWIFNPWMIYCYWFLGIIFFYSLKKKSLDLLIWSLEARYVIFCELFVKKLS